MVVFTKPPVGGETEEEKRRRIAEINRKKQEERDARRGKLSPKDPAREELRQKQLREDPLFAEKLRVVEERQQLQVEAQAQQELITPEQKGRAERLAALEEDRPVRRELDPFRFEEEKFPIIGGTFSSLSNIAKRITKSLGLSTEGEEFIKPEELKTLALTQIEKQEIERGLTASEEWGAFIEGFEDLPLIGAFAWQKGAEKPSENVQTIVRDIKAHKLLATDQELLVRQNLISKPVAIETIEQIEFDIQRLESRVRLLISGSPDLKFNSDGVNFIETKILQARNRVFQVKLNIENIVPGEIVDPSDIQILIALKGSIEMEDFTIPG